MTGCAFTVDVLSRAAKADPPLRGSKSAVEKLARDLEAAARADSCTPNEINSAVDKKEKEG